MAGIPVFQDTPDNLKSLQYGFDGTTVRTLKLDTSGRQVITTDVGTSIEVTATDLDIRNLSNTQDNIVVYGNDGTDNRALKTDASGRQIIATDVGTSIEVSAADLDIRNLSNTQDNIVVYGNDGTDNRALKTDASGRQIIATDVGTSIEVSAADLDIRNLSNTQDNIVVYGNDGTDNRALKTDITGVLQVAPSKTFTNQSESVTTADTYTGSTARDISLQNQYSFFVNNTGADSVTVKVQISPDNTLWIDDSTEFEVAAASADILTPTRFANFARVAYRSTVAGSGTTADIIYQSQA